MSKEFKNYDLRSIKSPMKPQALLSTVAVRDDAGQECYCYVAFSPKFVEAIGKKLPRGITLDDPAFLHVIHAHGHWNIHAQYVSDAVARLLWRTPGATPPTWLKFYKLKVENGNIHQTNPPG